MGRSLVAAFTAATLLLALGCSSATTPPASPDRSTAERSWSERIAALGLEPAAVVDPFEVTTEMEAWARRATGGAVSAHERLEQLQMALFDPREFEFSYDDTRTRTARQAFEARLGNCLSFTTMFVGMARSMGIPAFLLEVERVIDVEKRDGLVVVNRHVVAAHFNAGSGKVDVFDFYADGDASIVRFARVNDLAVAALLHSNIGADRLRAGRSSEAIQQLEIATTLEPTMATAWINLGVAHRRAGDEEAAFAAYRRALEIEPENASALANVAYLHHRRGDTELARTALTAATDHGKSPYALVALADVEIEAGELDKARRHLRQARRLDASSPEVWAGLARWARHAGEHELALKFRARQLRLEAEAAPSRPPEVKLAKKIYSR